MKQYVAEVSELILTTSSLIGLAKWRAAGFEELGILAQSVAGALCETDDVEQYHQLAWLHSWLFWIDLRKTNDAPEQLLLTAFFYGLVLAVLPLFPARYLQVLVEICIEKINNAQRVLGHDKNQDMRLGRLLELARSYF